MCGFCWAGCEGSIECIELFIEDQAFLLSYDLAVSPTPKLSLFLSLPVYRRSSKTDGRGGGEGRAKSNH
jgi:hypothetical protein